MQFGRFSASSWLNFGEHLGLSWAAFSSQAPRQTLNFLMDPFAVALPLVVHVVAGTRLAALIKDVGGPGGWCTARIRRK